MSGGVTMNMSGSEHECWRKWAIRLLDWICMVTGSRRLIQKQRASSWKRSLRMETKPKNALWQQLIFYAPMRLLILIRSLPLAIALGERWSYTWHELERIWLAWSAFMGGLQMTHLQSLVV